MASESTADKWFSYYIRLKYANEDGLCKCFTCSYVGHWKRDLQNGHGIGRQHKSTRYSEDNCKPQCKKCNNWGQGEQAIFAANVGKETWDKLEVQKRQLTKRSKFDFEILTDFYKTEARKLAKDKNIII